MVTYQKYDLPKSTDHSKYTYFRIVCISDYLLKWHYHLYSLPVQNTWFLILFAICGKSLVQNLHIKWSFLNISNLQKLWLHCDQLPPHQNIKNTLVRKSTKISNSQGIKRSKMVLSSVSLCVLVCAHNSSRVSCELLSFYEAPHGDDAAGAQTIFWIARGNNSYSQDFLSSLSCRKLQLHP